MKLRLLILITLSVPNISWAYTLIVMRHGEAKQNVEKILNGNVELSKKFPLTEKGIAQVHESAQALKTKLGLNGKNVAVVFSSPLLRTRQTAEILAKDLGIEPSHIVIDSRVQENGMGKLEGHPEAELDLLEAQPGGYLRRAKELFDGENEEQLQMRLKAFLKKVTSIKSGNVIVITHGTPAAELLKLADPTQAQQPGLKRGEFRAIALKPYLPAGR